MRSEKERAGTGSDGNKGKGRERKGENSKQGIVKRREKVRKTLKNRQENKELKLLAVCEQDRATAHTAQRHGQRTNITWLSYLQAALMSVNGCYYYSYHYCIIKSIMVSRP
jgi:hypothetical protein